ncbi:MAG: methyltransferase domain-containing protein [Novosphingobium sp.]|jgi:malonyl-CoA O-methyltransferase|nr:methyltransferase domain-containing protein [Novosphingobium sp.]
MTTIAKSRVAGAFDLATDYAAHAHMQHRVAQALAGRIAALPLPALADSTGSPRLLEIGCGTGFLTGALLDRGLRGDWLVTDIAPAMVDRCAAAIARRDRPPALEFAIMDGEQPLPRLTRRGFDVVCSSLTFQWFADLPAALPRLAALVAPGGVLAFTTLVAGTFEEWNRAHRLVGLEPGGLTYPGFEALATSFPEGGTLAMHEQIEREHHADAAAFLRSIKRIGAGTAAAGRRPLPPAGLRRVMAGFEAAGSRATYRIASCIWTRDRQA